MLPPKAPSCCRWTQQKGTGQESQSVWRKVRKAARMAKYIIRLDIWLSRYKKHCYSIEYALGIPWGKGGDGEGWLRALTLMLGLYACLLLSWLSKGIADSLRRRRIQSMKAFIAEKAFDFGPLRVRNSLAFRHNFVSSLTSSSPGLSEPVFVS